MQFTEFPKENAKVMVLLPGTGCSWELNFSRAIEDFKARYHLICVNYDGFETDMSLRTDFTDILTIVSKIEDYIIENHGGRVDGAYGSSLGGTLAAQLVCRERVHVDHCFIGGSDLDESGKLYAKIMTGFAGSWLENTIMNEKKAEKFKAMLVKNGMNMDADENGPGFIDGFISNIRTLKKGTVKQEFYSDYITRLPKAIDVKGTIIHVIYALGMDPKYEKRYLMHFKSPDIRRFDMQHEAWLFQKGKKDEVMACIGECMEMERG